MSQKTWVYVYTLRNQKIREGRNISTECYSCHNTITIGQEVYSRNANSAKAKSKIYHKKCAEGVNIL